MIIEKSVCVKALAEAGLVYQLREALLIPTTIRK